jgi:hypothetical protein
MRLKKRRCPVNRGASKGLLPVSGPRALGGAHVSPFTRIFRGADRRADRRCRSDDALRDSDLVVRKLAANYRIIVAANDYLESRGTPSVREDLLSHECLLYRSSGGCHGGGARQCAPSAQPLVRCGSSPQLKCPLRADPPRERHRGN